MSDLEKKQALAKDVRSLDIFFESRIRQVCNEKDVLWSKYHGVIPEADRWTLTPDDFMSREDAAFYRELTEEEIAFKHRVHHVIQEALELVSHADISEWERQPSPGVPGSPAETYSRHYQLILDDGVVLMIRWFNYPEDTDRVPESCRESYSVSIVVIRNAVVRKGFFRILRKMQRRQFPLPGLWIAQNDAGEFKPSPELENEFTEDVRARFQQQLLEVGTWLREKLG